LAAASVIVLLTAGWSAGRSRPANPGSSRPRFQATIRRTTDGVPHITSTTVAGVLYGQGYASAQDHACTLEDQVLKVTSQRSRWLGPGKDNENVQSDFGWKAVGIDKLARADWRHQSAAMRRWVAAFTDGWNAYLAKVGRGGLSGWCKGQAWVRKLSPQDIYSYARSVMLRASSGALIDYLGTAQPPAGAGAVATTTTATNSAFRMGDFTNTEVGSNGWAIGSERSSDGRGMLMANPHLPWEGDLRFWEVQLTVPGVMDVYGSELVGLPFVGIGFNDDVAWTHTDSSGHRFTAYRLSLDPADPTSYIEDGVTKKMTATPTTIEVRGDDGTITTQTRTLWSTQYGPVLDVPGLAWSATTAVAERDANLHNTAFFDQYYGMDTAKSLKQFQQVHAKNQGVPLFNTIATSADGHVWYADTAATPNLSAQAQADYLASLNTDPVAKTAADNGIVLLDGSKREFEWVDAPGARNPGLEPYSHMPKVERRDYVFNANDSYWMVNAEHPFTKIYSPMNGDGPEAQSLRTRENATVLRDTSATGPAGADGRFTLSELAAAAMLNRSTAERLERPTMVQRCGATPTVDVPALTADDGTVIFPDQTVDISQACRILTAWDGTFNADSAGAVLFRETNNDIQGGGWATPFDPAHPIDTPSGFAPVTPGQTDPATTALGRAVEILQKAGVPLDATMGQTQHDGREATGDPHRVYFGGGPGSLGITNVVGWDPSGSGTREPVPSRPDPVAPDSALTADGYWVNDGSSYMMVVDFTKAGPVARTILTYGETGDSSSPLFTSQTQRFATKKWKTVELTTQAVKANQVGRTVQLTA
jgi:acyl-homoserine-lactone acylase